MEISIIVLLQHFIKLFNVHVFLLILAVFGFICIALFTVLQTSFTYSTCSQQ